MDPRGSPPWFGAITVKSNFGRNRWPRGSRKFEFLGMVIFEGFDPFFYPVWPIGPKMDPMASPPWFGTITVKSNFGRNRWPRGNRKFEFWGMVIIYGFDPFFGRKEDPIGPRMDPKGSPRWFRAITVKSNFGRNRWQRGSRKFEFWGMVIFYGFDPFFFTQLDPIGLKMEPRGSPPWFGAITLNLNFGQNRWPRKSMM